MTATDRISGPPPLDAARHALFLDFDGTLVEIAPTPDAVRVAPELAATLSGLGAAMDGAVAIVSGRSARSVEALLGACVSVISGLHGQELLADGRLTMASPDPDLIRAREAALASLADTAPDVVLENKGAAFALHYRGAPESEALVRDTAEHLASEFGLRAIHGRMVSELMAKGHSKGRAVEALMRAAPFLGRVPIFVGDDVTDEDAFAIVNAAGGLSILVESRRETAAKARLESVSAVHAWLAEALNTEAA